MDTLANTPIFTEHLAFKADIQNDWTLCIKFPISELCRQLILLDAGSNYSVIRDLMQTIDPVAHWIKLLCKLKFVSETDN